MANKIRLAFAGGDYEIIRALKEGSVEVDGIELVVLTAHGPRERHWRMARNLEYDVCEFNVGAYFMARARNIAYYGDSSFSPPQISSRLCLC